MAGNGIVLGVCKYSLLYKKYITDNRQVLSEETFHLPMDQPRI